MIEYNNKWPNYNTLFIFINSLGKLDNLSGKTIYLYNFGYNFEDDELQHLCIHLNYGFK